MALSCRLGLNHDTCLIWNRRKSPHSWFLLSSHEEGFCPEYCFPSQKMQPRMIQREQHSKERCCNVMIKGTTKMYELIMPDFTFLWHFSSHSVHTYTALVILVVLSSCLFLKGISESLQRKAAKRNNHFMQEDSDERILFPWLWRKGKAMFRRDAWKTMHILHFLEEQKQLENLFNTSALLPHKFSLCLEQKIGQFRRSLNSFFLP